jgi:hypothetical protein
MSQHEKLLDRLRNPSRDNGWNFGELCQLLQKIGFEMRQSGSHHFFRRIGIPDVINLQSRGNEAKGLSGSTSAQSAPE